MLILNFLVHTQISIFLGYVQNPFLNGVAMLKKCLYNFSMLM